MARAKLSALLQSLEGRYGGGVFRSWKGLTVLSALQNSVANPNTASQVKYREVLGFASKHWKTMTFQQRGAWAAVASYLSSQWENYDNPAGTRQVIRVPRGPYTPLSALTATLGLLASIDEWDSTVTVPPAPDGATGPTQVTELGASGNTSGLVLTWENPREWGDLAEVGKVRIWVASEDGTHFPQLVASVPSTLTTYTITTLHASGSGTNIPIRPGWLFIQLDAVNSLGLRSAPGVTLAFNVPILV